MSDEKEAEIERWKSLAVHLESVADEAAVDLAIERVRKDGYMKEAVRLRTLTEAYGELLDAVFDWLGCDSVQDQEKALVVVATKAHEVHKLTEGA